MNSAIAGFYASVAQLVEQGTENPRVVGSIPTGGTTYADLAHLVERHLAKVEVAGSSPVIRSRERSRPKGLLFAFPGADYRAVLRQAFALRSKNASQAFSLRAT